MQITPDTVVYIDRTRFGTPERGLFAVVTFKAMNRGKAAVKTTAASGGFRWKTPGGHTVKQGEGKGAGKIAPIGFSEGGPTVRPDTYQAETVAFDITTAERGGTLVYVDGDGVAFAGRSFHEFGACSACAEERTAVALIARARCGTRSRGQSGDSGIDGAGSAVEQGTVVRRAGEAALQAVGLVRPAFAPGPGGAGDEVVADLHRPATPRWLGAKQPAADAGHFEPATARSNGREGGS